MTRVLPVPASHDDPGEATIQFSPDARFVLASPLARGSPIAWDLRKKKPVALDGEMKKIWSNPFVFVGSDRVLVSLFFNWGRITQARLVTFPSGRVISTPEMLPGPLARAADPAFVLIQPFGQIDTLAPKPNRGAAVEFQAGQIVIAAAPAMDIHGSRYLAECPNGDLGLFDRNKGLIVSVPLSPIEQ